MESYFNGDENMSLSKAKILATGDVGTVYQFLYKSNR